MDRDWLSMWIANWSSATTQHVGHGWVGAPVFTMHARCNTASTRLVPRYREANHSAFLFLLVCLPLSLSAITSSALFARGVRFCVTLFFGAVGIFRTVHDNDLALSDLVGRGM